MKRWKVPLADIDFGPEETAAVRAVLRSRWLSMGPVTVQFERAFRRFLGVQYAFAVASGTAALDIANRAIGLQGGDEVICPSLSFVATANTVLNSGAVPVFADITSLDDWTIAPANIINKITPRVRAIVVMHYGGYPCAMDEILAIAREHNLYVIEDAAHALGSEYRGRKCGTIGDIGCFSFFANKNMTTGEGGMVVTNRDDLAQRIRLLRSHGMTSLTWQRHAQGTATYDVMLPGYNYRIDEIRSAIGLVQLKKLHAGNRKRARTVQRYREDLRSAVDISIPFTTVTGKPACHLLPVLLAPTADRLRVIGYLKRKGIQTSVHYHPIHLFNYYRKKFGFQPGMLPLTETVGQRELTLPLHSKLTEHDIATVTNALIRAL